MYSSPFYPPIPQSPNLGSRNVMFILHVFFWPRVAVAVTVGGIKIFFSFYVSFIFIFFWSRLDIYLWDKMDKDPQISCT